MYGPSGFPEAGFDSRMVTYVLVEKKGVLRDLGITTQLSLYMPPYTLKSF